MKPMAPRAAERLNALWRDLYPDTPATIKKLIGKPKSYGATGWSWFLELGGEVHDLGYTEKDADFHIRHWNDPIMVSNRNAHRAVEELKVALDHALKLLEKMQAAK